MDATAREARRRVRAGAKLLDQVDPDWFKGIKLDVLDLGDCANCICGQYARYKRIRTDPFEDGEDRYELGLARITKVAQKLGLEFEAAYLSDESPNAVDSIAYGFIADDGWWDDDDYVTYALLDKYWRVEIEKRLAV